MFNRLEHFYVNVELTEPLAGFQLGSHKGL